MHGGIHHAFSRRRPRIGGSLITSIGCIITALDRIVHLFSRDSVKKEKIPEFHTVVAKIVGIWYDKENERKDKTFRS